jgi:catechol 2,3-dioxygenase-like lactoylglutathione lyase family enzyme
MTVKRMDNVGIVVEDLGVAVDFFIELGLEVEGRATIEGEWAGRITGLGDQNVEVAMMRTPDGHSRLEISRFIRPSVVADHRTAPVNALGYLRVMFAVEDLDDTLARLHKRGAQLVGEVVQYGNSYRLCYIRGPEGILIGLAQELGGAAAGLESVESGGKRAQVLALAWQLGSLLPQAKCYVRFLRADRGRS